MTHDDRQRGVQRRTLVRGAAHAAWAVPAVTAVSAAPAFATSTIDDLTDGLLSLSYSAADRSVSVGVTQVTNDGPRALPANTVYLAMTLTTTRGRWFTNNIVRQQGDWGAWDFNTTYVRFRYGASVPIGAGLPLGGYVVPLFDVTSGRVDATLTHQPPGSAAQVVAVQTITF